MQIRLLRTFPFLAAIVLLYIPCRLPAAVRGSQEALSLDLERSSTLGGAFAASRKGSGWELAVSQNDKAGQWTAEAMVNLDTYPLFVFQVPELSRECAWSLSVSDATGRNKRLLQKDAPNFGQFEYDLTKATGWSGTRRLRLDFNVRGPAGWILVQNPTFCRRSASSSKAGETPSALQYERMNRALVNARPDEITLSLMNAKGPEWEWGGVLSKPTVDTDKYPFAELDVRSLSPNGSFRFAVGGITSGPVDRNAAILSFNYRDPSRWQGLHEVPIQLTVSGSGTRLGYRPIRFLPYPSLSSGLVTQADTSAVDETADEKDIASGGLLLHYEPKSGLFRIRRKDGKASLATRFLEVDGLNLGGDIRPSLRRTKNATGERLTYERRTDRTAYSVEVETTKSVEGLLHWRVTATPSGVTHFSSCGHELCYVPSAGSATPSLRRIAAQSWSGSGLAFVEAPGVGNILYFQNYTALNPVFERCHIAPRFWVSASARTFGFPAPLDIRASFPADQPVVLSDVWLYVAPEQGGEGPADTLQGNRRDAALFLQGLAAIYGALPDRPATDWQDWQKLARRSLQDLYNGECWASWENGIYLKAYVGTVGASPQLTGMQDVIGPVLAFKNLTGEGGDMYNRLRAEIPHFWSDRRNSLLLFANDPNSNWWSLEQIVGVCRAAQNGDMEAKSYCLRAADTFIRMGRDSKYDFQHFSEIKDVQNGEREYAGVFILYMMLLHELSGDVRFVEEAKHAADQIPSWDFPSAKLAAWSAMTCEGLARLYAATGDARYIYDSFIPLAGLLRNAWLWECDYGHAKGYKTFFGFNSDAGGVDYITGADQHQVWHSLYQYYLRAYPVMPVFTRLLVAEAIRYIPQVTWYTYPTNLPPESLHEGEPFWHSKNIFSLAIPVEDLNDGWRKNGSVGQELYGAGAAFDIASKAYIRVPEAGVLLYCEYPVLKTQWLDKEKAVDVEIGGLPQYEIKVEIRRDPLSAQTGSPLALDKLKITSNPTDTAQVVSPRKSTFEEGLLRTTVPGGTRLRISLP